MILRPPRSTPLYSSAASDVYKRQVFRHAVASERGVRIARHGHHRAAQPGNRGDAAVARRAGDRGIRTYRPSRCASAAGGAAHRGGGRQGGRPGCAYLTRLSGSGASLHLHPSRRDHAAPLLHVGHDTARERDGFRDGLVLWLALTRTVNHGNVRSITLITPEPSGKIRKT